MIFIIVCKACCANDVFNIRNPLEMLNYLEILNPLNHENLKLNHKIYE